MKIVTLNEARTLGLKRYFTGKPCKNGHVTERRLPDTHCLACVADQLRKWNNSDKGRASKLAWATADPERKKRVANRWHAKHGMDRYRENRARILERRRKRYAKNPEKYNKQNAAWYAANIEQATRQVNAWRQRNQDRCAASAALRRARKKLSRVSLTQTERKQITQLYKLRDEMSRVTGIQHHVDHVVPLSKGGAHHPSNLQILTAAENLRKSARL